MNTATINSIWNEWSVTDFIGEDSQGKLFKAERNGAPVKTYCSIRTISVPLNEKDIETLYAKGVISRNNVKHYYNAIAARITERIRLFASLNGINNTVSVFDYKIVEKTDSVGFDIYIRTELVTPFEQYIKDNKLPQATVLKLGTDICRALEDCYQKNISSLTVSPETIYVNNFGEFRFIDFGVDKELSLTDDNTYKAPETVREGTQNAVSSMYSLALIMYRLLSNGKLPFLNPYSSGVTSEDIKNATERRLSGEIPMAPVSASRDVADIILTACAPETQRRFISITAFKSALESVTAATPAPAPAPAPAMAQKVQTPPVPKINNPAPVPSVATPVTAPAPAAVTTAPVAAPKKSHFATVMAIILAFLLVVTNAFSWLVTFDVIKLPFIKTEQTTEPVNSQRKHLTKQTTQNGVVIIDDNCHVWDEESLDEIMECAKDTSKRTGYSVMIVVTDDTYGKDNKTFSDDYYNEEIKKAREQFPTLAKDGYLFLINLADKKSTFLSKCGRAETEMIPIIYDAIKKEIEPHLNDGDYKQAMIILLENTPPAVKK